jgi:hypothetical protein
VNYRSLEISSNALRYVELSGQIHIALFENMVKVEFVREEALFPCFDGPYLETKWIIYLIKNVRIEVMDEAHHRKKLFAAFSSYLHGFDPSVASVGLHSGKAGRWFCYQSSSLPVENTQHQS